MVRKDGRRKNSNNPNLKTFALTDQRSGEIKKCHHLKSSEPIKKGVQFSAGVKHHHSVPDPWFKNLG